MNTLKNYGLGGVALVIAIIALFGGYHSGNSVKNLGGTTNYDTISVNGLALGTNCNIGFSTGCTGTSLTHFIGTTGSLIRTDASQTGTTTSPYDIAVTNMLITDNCIAQFASTTIVVNNNMLGGTFPTGWAITSCHASTTAGFATVMVANLTGRSAALINSGGIASSTQLWIFQ